VCRSKHVEPSINVGIINSITRLHLVGYFYWFTLICIYVYNERETEHSHTFTFNVLCFQRANNACFTHSLETRSSFLLEIHPCPPVHQSLVKPVRLAVSVDFRFHSDSVYVGWTAHHAEYEYAHWASGKGKGSREMYWRTVTFHCFSFASVEHTRRRKSEPVLDLTPRDYGSCRIYQPLS
jgi:hypothetical protein